MHIFADTIGAPKILTNALADLRKLHKETRDHTDITLADYDRGFITTLYEVEAHSRLIVGKHLVQVYLDETFGIIHGGSIAKLMESGGEYYVSVVQPPKPPFDLSALDNGGKRP